jgi:hypothetical protein
MAPVPAAINAVICMVSEEDRFHAAVAAEAAIETPHQQRPLCCTSLCVEFVCKLSAVSSVRWGFYDCCTAVYPTLVVAAMVVMAMVVAVAMVAVAVAVATDFWCCKFPQKNIGFHAV